jgi:hypothetical protein
MRLKPLVRLFPIVPVVSLFLLGPGCDMGGSSAPPAAPESVAKEQETERAARQAAYGKTGVPGKTSTPKPAAK